MRTTLTLEPDVARALKERVHETRSTLKEVVNEAIRRGLSASEAPPRERFVIEPHDLGGFLPGVDPVKPLANLDDEYYAKKFRAEDE